MAITRTQIDAICTKMQGSGDLGPGGVLALKEVLYLLNDEINELAAEPVVLATSSTKFTEGYIAVGSGGVIITLDAPNPGEIEFKI